MSHIIRRPQASCDIAEIADYIAEDNLDAALRLVDAYDAAVKRLAEHPHIGTIFQPAIRRLSGLRVWPIHGFSNYLIFYRPLDGGIEVLRVIHGMRNVRKELRSNS